MRQFLEIIKFLIIYSCCVDIIGAVTMQQFEQSLDMMRNGCAPKFKVPLELLDKLRNGEFTDSHAELKCYVKCVAQLAGTVTKKGDFSYNKALAQIPIILPPELQTTARNAIEACKDAQAPYKESCERIYFVTKCVRDFHPPSFKFP